ncbi:RtcB family protein [Neisseria weixii]|uniref:RtcB family protein n=1 Tax=Neisseria weixii TaxID=1853276 RepID=UPI0035A0EF0F
MFRRQSAPHLIQQRHQVLIYKEVPQAYKGLNSIIVSMSDFGLIELVARMKPVLTYKNAGGCAD